MNSDSASDKLVVPVATIWDAIVDDLAKYEPEILCVIAGKLIQHAGTRPHLVKLFLEQMQPLTRTLFMGKACAFYSGAPK